MAIVKVVKNATYFRRYQVKFKRRRQGKTDYHARKRLIHQAQNQVGELKYRLVVRITNYQVLCQIVSAHVEGDRVHECASSFELKSYGVKVGPTNWAAAYLTGLLCARRMLKKMGKESVVGQAIPDGSIDEYDESGFRVHLDIGLARATRGAKVFAAMKGASDGGLFVPHSGQRFPGYDPATKKNDPEMLRSYIYGQNIANYMRELEDRPEEYKRQFSKYMSASIGPDDIEPMYQKAMEQIRANPERKEEAAERKKSMKSLPPRKKSRKMTREEKEEAKRERVAKLEKELGVLPVTEGAEVKEMEIE